MKRILFFWVIGSIMLMAGSISVAKAGLKSVIGGISAPASTLGPYSISPFADDLRQSCKKYSFVTSPLIGDISFDLPLEHREILKDWATWSHGYTGDVYWTGEEDHLVTLTMPAGTSAFYFYAQPQNVEINTITAVAFDGADCIEQISQEVYGNSGACYYGFYGTEGSVITKIRIYSDTEDFAIGEFGISMIPAPEAFVLGNIGLSFVLELRRHRIFGKKKI